jgi:hypothetical protein
MDLSRNKLPTSSVSLYFLLNIMFIGHPDDGSDPVMISTCNMLMNLIGISFDLTSSGGNFEISFIEMSGFTGKIGAQGTSIETDYIGNVKVITTEGASNTIGSLIDSLETQLNIQSLEFYQKFSNSASANNRDAKNKKIKYGKLVQYMITVPDEIRAYPVDHAVKSNNNEIQFLVKKPTGSDKEETKKPLTTKQVTGAAHYSSITLSQTSTITKAILTILKTSNEFLKKSTDDFIKANKGEFVRSMITNTADDTTYVLHFDIMINKIPLVSKMAEEFKANNPINVMAYDYIFTGHNSHIVDFKLAYAPGQSLTSIDMDTSFGKNRLAEVASAGQKKEDVKATNKGVNKTTEYSTSLRPQDPVFFALTTKDAKSNNAEQYNEAVGKEDSIIALKNKQNFAKTYARINFLGAQRAELVIRGNPNIIKKYADRSERNGIPPHIAIVSGTVLDSIVGSGEKTATGNFAKLIQPGFKNAKAQYISDYIRPKEKKAQARQNQGDALLNGIDIQSLPVWVKLNIKYPNVDYNGNFIQGEEMYTSDFFFNGYYQILRTKSSFQNGSFTQSMTLLPWDIDDALFSDNDEKVSGTTN